ncbi:hypothetical protein [Alcaligenes nematophilus]|uniref:hypothetical protein n=1 Tax=Alcaligenes nematophilus TaxID=2994643 RepID=UPI00384FA6B7
MDYMSIKHGWWRSVTPSELRKSADVINIFLHGEGKALANEIEEFARALALSQLFNNPEAVTNAAESISKSMRSATDVRDSKDAMNWLARHQAFLDGFNLCLDFLDSQAKIDDWRKEAEYIHLKASINEKELIRSAESDEIHAKVRTEIMEREKLAATKIQKGKL